MTPMKDYIKVEVTGDADAVTSELYVENTIENPAWYTVEDNHVSLVSENIEKVIKVETDMLDDCMWESRIEISKDVANENNAELPLESQNVAVNNIDLNPEKTSNKMFYCNICGKSFALNYLLKNHLAEHKRQINIKNNKCKYCGRQFKLKFGLNRHIQKFHNEHMKSHKNNEARIDSIPNIKLRKLNGVWKSKTNVFKCNICFLKCHSEKNLVEHMETHDNCQIQCNDCLKYVSVSELDNHMQQLHNKHLYKCQKCNLQFVKQQHLNCHSIHCLKSLQTKSNKVCGPFKDNSTTCSACGIIFNNSLSLKNHITMGCKHYTCKYCGQYFSSRILWLRHVDVHEKDEQRVMFRVNKISTVRKYNQTEAVNDSSLNTSEGQLLYRNVTRRNNSEQNDLMNSNSTTVSTASNNSMANDCGIQNIKQEKHLNANAKEKNTSHQVINNQSTVSVVPQNSANNCLFLNIKQEKIISTDAVKTNSSDQINLANSNESTISTFSHNSIVNDCHVLNIKQEKITSTNVIETNSSDQINLANSNESIISTVSQNLIVNDCLVLNIKQEKNTSLNVKRRENSDQMDLVNDNESTVENRLHDLMAYEDSININVANNSVSTIRETPYFCIRKLPYIKNIFCNDVNDQTSHNNVIFICRICKKSPSTDIHSFALHMSEHVECNMHECIVCDKTFSTVLLWANHMTYHQQQLDLNISAVQCNITEIESNTSGPIDSGNMEPQVSSTSRNRKFKMSSLDDSYSDVTSMNTSVDKVKYQYDCSTCKKIFPSKFKLKAHQTIHAKPQSFSCRYCDRIFSGKGQCTNHEKSHIGLDKACFQNNENYTPEAILIQNNISIENNNINTETMSIKHKNQNKLSSTIKKNHCHLCNKKFSKRCYFTNHMQIKHNINPNLPKQLISISDNENKLPVPVDSDLNNHLNKSNEKKSKFCTVCNKYFAHMGALTNHMNIHLDRKPYKCQYCYKQFSKEASYILHEKKHMPKNKVNEEPQIENSNDFELVDNPVDGNSNDTNLINMKDLWFTCDVCEKKFSTPFQLNLHRKLHSNIVPYVCKICNRSYSLKFRWNWHLKGHYLRHIRSLKSKRHTNDIKSNVESIQHNQDRIKCRYCKKEYNSISQWKKHMTMNKECRRHCKNNLPEFASNHALKNLTKSCRFKCNICKKTYSTSYNRSIHIKNVHNELDTTVLNNHNNTNFQKDKPMEIIQQKPVIKKQNRSNHINGSGTKCKLCGKVYSSAANLGRHVSIIHTKRYEPMTCNVCGRTFKHKFSFREHLKIKHKKLFKNYEEINVKNKRATRKIISINKKRIMKYFCKICKMKFADNITLQEHSKIHIVDMYNCKDCGQQFETNVTLGNHIMENHSGDNSISNKNNHIENYENQNTSLKIINNNPAQCKICLKILKDPGYLHEHMRLHTGDKPFKCDQCNMTFRFKSNLRMHQKKDMPCYIP